MSEPYTRDIEFEGILNFRDIGGLKAQDGRMTQWRRVFRSGELHYLTQKDLRRLKGELGVSTIVDLRGSRELTTHPFAPSSRSGMKYIHLPLRGTPLETTTLPASNLHMGHVYASYLGQRQYAETLVSALRILAEPGYFPLVFHCSAGKDRTGVLAAVVQGVLGVADEEIVEDYAASGSYMEVFRDRLLSDPKASNAASKVPSYGWKAESVAMETVLSFIGQRFGSIRGYMSAHGADGDLLTRLEDALLA
jgi:protein-tyrosine phosphatase